ncbi:MAG: LTA synthase family protein [Candidatus Muirbacterium halophilum]|nr:LTA synthase family protein [Candidatus Muirbacterium halophilum]MCK9475203.1 LTA synthase family protein [Candidatus Muirbacterium halophilum]
MNLIFNILNIRNGITWIILSFSLLILMIFTLFRIFISIWKYKEIKKASSLSKILFTGFKFDIMTISYLNLIPFFLITIFFVVNDFKEVFCTILKIYYISVLDLIIFLELSTYSFMEEYGVRPDRIFIEYLIYPKEVGRTLWKEYKIQIIFAIFLLTLTTIFLSNYFIDYNFIYLNKIIRILYSLIFLILVVAGARSSFGHRAANISMSSISSSKSVNDLTLNSLYSVLYAVYRIKDEKNSAKIYGNINKDILFSSVRKHMLIPYKNFISENHPTLHYQESTYKNEKPLNVVIIIEESLGASFVKSLGGKDLCPNLEKLKSKGLWFENLYATGTRTVRGIEAIISGFLPTPGRSVVKLGFAQNNFFTIASLLKDKGYTNHFFYGGESHFDNMSSFFMGNGFDFMFDEKNIKKYNYKGTWGICDEDIFLYANNIFKQQRNPFLSVILTTSNHSPYEFPDNKIEFKGKKNNLENTVRYADYSLGSFFEKASQEKYYNETVFLIVADHELRVSGENLVPVEKFHIPGLIISPNLKPGNYSEISSQIDLPVTLLSILGISSIHPMSGRDLTKNHQQLGRAIIQYGNNFSYVTENNQIILSPGIEPQHFELKNGSWIKNTKSINTNLVETALSHAILPSYLYSNKLYTNNKEK